MNTQTKDKAIRAVKTLAKGSLVTGKIFVRCSLATLGVTGKHLLQTVKETVNSVREDKKQCS